MKPDTARLHFSAKRLTEKKGEVFCKIMRRYKEVFPYVFESQYRFEEAGKEGADRMLKEAPECTAVLCAYDNIAYGAIKRLKEKGYKIPCDYSVIGCNNLDFSEYTDIPLSSLDLKDEAMAQTAWELMKKKLENSYFRAFKPTVIHGNLVLKGTVAPPRTENSGGK